MTPYVKGMYRSENIDYAKQVANEQNNAANAARLAETLKIMRDALRIQSDELCSVCHREPIAVYTYGGFCAYCWDTVEF